MSNEHGDLNFNEDELDGAIKGHARSAPPNDLLDRCLATTSPQSRATDPVSSLKSTFNLHATSPAFIRWTIGASIVVGTAGAYFWYDYEQRARHEVAVVVAQVEIARPSVESEPFDETSGAPAGPAETASLASLQEQQKNYEALLQNINRYAEQAKLYEEASRQKEEEVRLLREQFKAARVAWEDLTALRRNENSSSESLRKESKPREDEVQLLREQLATTREQREGAVKKQFDTQQSLIEFKGTFETLEKRTAELEEAREKQLDAILIRRGLLNAENPNSESYAPVVDNPFLPVDKNPLSTFSADVDTASFSNVRRFLNQGTLPPRDAVRIEELINYFTYDYPQPEGPDPFSVNLEVAGCPWNGDHRLVRIGLKGREIADQQRPPTSLVFLVDVSGSMQPANKLPLLKNAMKMLVQRLSENERVAIVTYSHELRLVLPSTTCDSKETIIQALDSLQAAGSTNGAGGIQLAYQIAVENFIKGGVNRVILATDGDFNVGITDRDELTRFIEEKARSGVFLSVLGFGMGNLKDATLERLADRGNGHFAYIDTIDEARKLLVDQLSGTLVTIAKDVKLQLEFNPATVSAYRLIGYENRVMAAQDFNDDRKDAGDMGAGHTVTALYEIVPAGKSAGLPGIDPLKYQPDPKASETRRLEVDANRAGTVRGELLTVKLRYKQPDGSQSKLLEVALTDSGRRYSEASVDFRFASAVAAFGMILRDSPYRGTATLSAALELAHEGLGPDRQGYRNEFLKLVLQAQALQPR